MSTTAPPRIPRKCEVIGVAGIAELAGVPAGRVSLWRNRGLLVEPRWHLADRIPAWDKADVVAWLETDQARRLIAASGPGRPPA